MEGRKAGLQQADGMTHENQPRQETVDSPGVTAGALSLRPLKFKVWDRLERRMITPDEGYQGHYTLSLTGRFHNLQNGSGGNECCVVQFTGCIDQGGIEIYEGDVLSHSQGAGVVLMDESDWSLKVGGNLPLSHAEKTRVIGNLFSGLQGEGL